jgi:hypothetical protein
MRHLREAFLSRLPRAMDPIADLATFPIRGDWADLPTACLSATNSRSLPPSLESFVRKSFEQEHQPIMSSLREIFSIVSGKRNHS